MPDYLIKDTRTCIPILIAGLVSYAGPVIDNQISAIPIDITHYENYTLDSSSSYTSISENDALYSNVFSKFVSKIEDTPNEILDELNDNFWEILA